MNLSRMAFRLLPVLAAIGASMALFTAGAAPNQDSARGRVDQGFQVVDFSAKSSATGFNASGSVKITFPNADPNDVYVGEVTCLRVVGATATTPAMASIGGVITKAPPGSFASSFIIFTSDSGKFSNLPDGFSGGLSGSPPPVDGACPTPFAGSPVADGEVIIENALP